MRSLNFTGAILKIGGNQNQYNTLYAKLIDGFKGEVAMIFELTDDEVAEIVRTKKLVYTQLTFNKSFSPMRIMTQWPNKDVPEILPDLNQDPKLN